MTELSPQARALLDAARDGDRPSRHDRQRVAASLVATIGPAGFGGAGSGGLGGGGGAGVSAGGAKVATGVAGGGFKLALWFAAGSAIGLGAVAIAVPVFEEASPRAVAPPAPLAAPHVRSLERPHRVEAPATPRRLLEHQPVANTLVKPPRGEATPARRAPVRMLAAPPPDHSDAPSVAPPNPAPTQARDVVSLASELELVQAAQARLNAGNAQAALSLLGEHARKYPAGALAPERLAATVHALCALGRVRQARDVAAQLETGFPSSPLLPPVRSSCVREGSFSETD